MPSPDRDPNAGGPAAGENRSGGESTPESLPDREDRRRQEDILQEDIPQPRNTSRREEGSRREEKEDRWPDSGLISAAVEVVFLEALSGDALRVGLPVSEVSAPERPEAATGRVPAVVYL